MYIQLRVTLQKLKGIAASQGRDVNSLCSYKLIYVNSIDLNPPSSVPLDSAAADHLDKMEGLMVNVVKCLNSLTAKPTRNNDDNDDQDDNSQSSLNQTNMLNFFKGAQT